MRGQLACPLRPTASIYIGLGTEDFELLDEAAPSITVQMISGVPAQPREIAAFATGIDWLGAKATAVRGSASTGVTTTVTGPEDGICGP